MATFQYKTGITSLTLSSTSFPTPLFCAFEFLLYPFLWFCAVTVFFCLFFFIFSLLWGDPEWSQQPNCVIIVTQKNLVILQKTCAITCFSYFVMICACFKLCINPCFIVKGDPSMSVPCFFIKELVDDAKQRSVEEVRPTMSLWTVGMICDCLRVINIGGSGRRHADLEGVQVYVH